MEYAGGCYAYNNHTMFFSRRVMLVVVEREVYPCCRIRGKFETISRNRETDGQTEGVRTDRANNTCTYRQFMTVSSEHPHPI